MGWDLVRSAQASSPALRTARDVLAGQAQEELLPVLTRERRRGFRSDVEQLATERDALLPDGIGEQSVMADADEAWGEHVKQKAAQERLGGERHGLASIAVGPILVEEGHLIAVHRDDAFVGDRDAMSVAAEVGEYLLGACEGAFAVDHPLVARGVAQQLRDRDAADVGRELARGDGAVECGDAARPRAR